MKIKKNAVDLTDLAIGIIVLGIVVAIGTTAIVTYRDARTGDLDVITSTNESTTIDASTNTLANSWGKTISACVNGTDTIPVANYSYSVSASDGLITITNATLHDYNLANCTYTWYNTSRVDWQLANDSAIGLLEYGNWFKIIVIVGIAALVLGLIFMAFGRSGGGESSGGVAY